MVYSTIPQQNTYLFSTHLPWYGAALAAGPRLMGPWAQYLYIDALVVGYTKIAQSSSKHQKLNAYRPYCPPGFFDKKRRLATTPGPKTPKQTEMTNFVIL